MSSYEESEEKKLKYADLSASFSQDGAYTSKKADEGPNSKEANEEPNNEKADSADTSEPSQTVKGYLYIVFLDYQF